MATKTSSFESFLDGYIKNLAIKNEPADFSTYAEATMREIERIKEKSKTLADESYALSTRPYGRRDEILASYGLYGSGYNKYQNALKLSERAEALASADEKAISAERDAYYSYLDYLESETRKQNNLESSVTRTLTENKILDPVEIYKYAVESGMTKDRAEASITKVYNAVKNVVKRDIIERLASNEYDADLAVAYAKSVGLKGKDLEEIEELAKAVVKNFSTYTKDFSDALEDLDELGDHTNETH